MKCYYEQTLALDDPRNREDYYARWNQEHSDRNLHDYIRRQLDKHAIDDVDWTPTRLLKSLYRLLKDTIVYITMKIPKKVFPYMLVYSPFFHLGTYIVSYRDSWTKYFQDILKNLLAYVALDAEYYSKWFKYFPVLGNLSSQSGWFANLTNADASKPDLGGPLASLGIQDLKFMDNDLTLYGLGEWETFPLLNGALNLLFAYLLYKLI